MEAIRIDNNVDFNVGYNNLNKSNLNWNFSKKEDLDKKSNILFLSDLEFQNSFRSVKSTIIDYSTTNKLSYFSIDKVMEKELDSLVKKVSKSDSKNICEKKHSENIIIDDYSYINILNQEFCKSNIIETYNNINNLRIKLEIENIKKEYYKKNYFLIIITAIITMIVGISDINENRKNMLLIFGIGMIIMILANLYQKRSWFNE